MQNPFEVTFISGPDLWVDHEVSHTRRYQTREEAERYAAAHRALGAHHTATVRDRRH